MGTKSKKAVLGTGDEDGAVVRAADVLKRHFLNKKNGPIRTPYFQHQLQVLYEKDFFMWVVARALENLVEEKYLVIFDKSNVPELRKMGGISDIKFYANSKAVKTKLGRDRMRRHVVNAAKIVMEYSNDEISSARGRHLEALVKAQLQILQFDIIGEHTNKYRRKRWTKSSHDLDFIARQRETGFTIGVEVKNTMALMPADEMRIKMDMCEHFGIVPVFATRWNKPYVSEVASRGGFNWMFKTQIYPFGYENRVKKWFKKLSVPDKIKSNSYQMKYPMTVRGDLPEKSVEKFRDWVRGRAAR